MRKNLVILAVTAFLSGFYQSMVQVVWQPYVLSLGASISTLGQLNSLGGFGGLAPSLVQPVGGWLSDQTGHKPFIQWASVSAMAALGFYFMAGQAGNWLLLIPGVLLLGGAAISRPSRNAMVAEASSPSNRGTAYSLMIVAASLSGIVAPLLGGYIADHAGRKLVFLAGIIFEAVSLLIIIGWLREARVRRAESITLAQIVGVFRRAISPPPRLRTFFLCVAGDSFAWGVSFGVLFGALNKTFGFSDSQLGVLNSAFSIVLVLTQMPLGRFIDRYGTKVSMVLSEALGLPLMLIWLTQTRFEWFVFSFALFGLVGATWMPATMTYLTGHVSASSRSEAIGQLSAFRGLIAFPAPAIGGWLYEWGGFRAPVAFSLAGVIVVMLALAIFLKEKPCQDE